MVNSTGLFLCAVFGNFGAQVLGGGRELWVLSCGFEKNVP